MKKSSVILCTGGIGSGKSYIVKVFNALGVPSYDADSNTKRLYDIDCVLLERINAIAGGDVVKDGVLQRAAFAAKIFSDPRMLAEVESVVHPAVAEDFLKWKEEQESDIVLMESAILLEKPLLLPIIDHVLVVHAPEEIRIERVMTRDNVSRERVLQRISNQWSDSRRLEMADFSIETNDRDSIIAEVMDIIKTIRDGKR
ncbi:MAG: dephospho-CoA kinase [Bacteroidales bacterium]|jgi:dephospho-CoA kinase|nr:dephospho-CoA kinase [Bacteroidales bacterium]